MADDLFAQLPDGQCDDIVFPVVSCTIVNGSASANHQFPHRPGQMIELTGREPIHGTMEIALFNSLRQFNGGGVKGGAQSVQWPGVAQSLREKAQAQKLCKLVVPPYGTIPRAKIKLTEKYDPRTRNGCYATIEWTEDSRDLIQKGSVDVSASAAGMDESWRNVISDLLANRTLQLNSIIPTDDGWVDITTAIGQLKAIVDQAAYDMTAAQRLAQQIDSAIMGLIKSVRALGDALCAGLMGNLLDTLFAVRIIATEPQTMLEWDITRYVTAGTMSMSDVASDTGNTLEQVIQLNPGVPLEEIEPKTILWVLVQP